MKRNFEKRIEDGREIVRKHPRSDLSLTELDALIDLFYKDYKDEGKSLNDGLIRTIARAFDLGVSVGNNLK